MSKEQVMDYVMTTPSNPNRAVLSGMLDSIANAGGGSTLRVSIANFDQTEGKITYDKTWQEVHNALESGMDVTYQYPSGMYLRILAASSSPNLGYSIMSETLSSTSGSTTVAFVLDTTFFTRLTSPDDYLIAQGSSGGGSEQGQ